jgi:hypothetical protein
MEKSQVMGGSFLDYEVVSSRNKKENNSRMELFSEPNGGFPQTEMDGNPKGIY